jgi:hypothetical protein
LEEKRALVLKLVGIFIAIAILFSYAPVIPKHDCQEGDHMGNKKMDCGYSFHCPITVNMSPLKNLNLPFKGRLVSTPSLMRLEEFPYFIFHPPKPL